MGAVMQAQELRFGLRSCDLGSGVVAWELRCRLRNCDTGSGAVTQSQELWPTDLVVLGHV